MAIDLLNERLMPLSDVPAFLESRGVVKRGGGGRVSVRTIQLWIARGKLEATPRVMGIQHTSEEALARMLAGDVSPAREGRSVAQSQRKQRTRRDRERSHAAAGEYLKKEGVA